MRWWTRTSPSKKARLLFPTFYVGGYNWLTFLQVGIFDVKKPLKKYTKEEWNKLLHLDDPKTKGNAPGN